MDYSQNCYQMISILANRGSTIEDATRLYCAEVKVPPPPRERSNLVELKLIPHDDYVKCVSMWRE